MPVNKKQSEEKVSELNEEYAKLQTEVNDKHATWQEAATRLLDLGRRIEAWSVVSAELPEEEEPKGA
jgi:chromosome segregation ATPase